MVGANLARRLVGSGFRVMVMSRPGAGRVRLAELRQGVEILEGDLADEQTVRRIVERAHPQIVVHLASTPFNPPETSALVHLQVNAVGTLHLLEAVRTIPDVKVVFTGSAATYGAGACLREGQPLAPATVFGASKACASMLMSTYARVYGTRTVELRLFTPYGPWEHPRRLIPHTILSALAGQDIQMSRGDQQRDFIYIDDVVEALVLAATQPTPPGAAYNIGVGQGVPVRQVADRILALMGRPVKLLAGALPTRSDEIMEMSADITAVRAALGWTPRISLDEGLRRAIAWFTEHQEIARALAVDGV